MDYMNQEKKAKIAAALKLVMPKDWKYSLRCDQSSITMTVKSAPIPAGDMVEFGTHPTSVANLNSYQLNTYYPGNVFSGKTLEIVKAAIAAINTDNYDHSDSQSDYFCVNFYAYLQFGKWNKSFVNTAK